MVNADAKTVLFASECFSRVSERDMENIFRYAHSEEELRNYVPLGAPHGRQYNNNRSSAHPRLCLSLCSLAGTVVAVLFLGLRGRVRRPAR